VAAGEESIIGEKGLLDTETTSSLEKQKKRGGK